MALHLLGMLKFCLCFYFYQSFGFYRHVKIVVLKGHPTENVMHCLQFFFVSTFHVPRLQDCIIGGFEKQDMAKSEYLP